MRERLMNRRQFMRWSCTAVGIAASGPTWASSGISEAVPSYSANYQKIYGQNPHTAGLEWSRDAKFGLFIHYCPNSRLEKVHLFRLQELYDHIHRLQPQTLVSYRQGVTGTEDFLAPERRWKEKSDKPLEICDTLQPRQWFYNKSLDGRHKTAEHVMTMLAGAGRVGANLLLNTGPLPDGSIHPEDVNTLKEVGKRLRNRG